jgi:hypothetical protein
MFDNKVDFEVNFEFRLLPLVVADPVSSFYDIKIKKKIELFKNSMQQQ